MLVTKQGPKKGLRWLQEYSTVMLDKIQGRIISTAKMNSLPRRPSVRSKLSKADSLPSNASDFMTRMTQHYDILSSVDSFDFDAFTVCEHLGRKDTFVMTVFRMMQNLKFTFTPTVELNYDKLIAFLKAIKRGY